MRALTTGSVGTAKGQAVDDDGRKLLALHVDALPEGAGCRRGRRWGLAEPAEQHMPRCGAVQQQRVGQLTQQAVMHEPHLRVAGEQAKGAAAGDLKHAADAFSGRAGRSPARVGPAWRAAGRAASGARSRSAMGRPARGAAQAQAARDVGEVRGRGGFALRLARLLQVRLRLHGQCRAGQQRPCRTARTARCSADWETSIGVACSWVE